MNRISLLFSALLVVSTMHAQTIYTHTLPTMEGFQLSNWQPFVFPNTTPTTGGGTLSFQWRACWQDAFGGSSKIWFELETSTGTYTQVYYETGNTSSCSALPRTATISAAVMANALNTGGGTVRGRVKIQDSCYPGVGCSFYNDPQVLLLTLSYTTQAANFSSADATICPGGTVAFTDASLNTPSSYEWLFPGGTPATSTSQNPTVQYAATGTYDVTLIVETLDGMDTLVRPQFVTVYALPLANAGVDEDVCAGESAQLQASGGSSYQWFPADGLSNPNVAAPMATPTASTSYTVLVTSGNGCQASDNMVLTVHPLPNVQASAGNNTICLGDTAQVVAVGAQLYQWSPNLFISATSGASVNVWPTSTFTWTVNGTDGFGCENEGTLTITVQPPPAAPVITVAGTELISTVASSYQWYLNGTAIPGATEQEWTPVSNGNYSVQVSDANGCSTLGLPVYYGTVGVAEGFASAVRIYPQPVRDQLTLEGLRMNASARIFDMQGAMVWQGTVTAGPVSTLDLAALASGAYTLELSSGMDLVRLPLVKE